MHQQLRMLLGFLAVAAMPGMSAVAMEAKGAKWEAHKLGATRAQAVYWIGHSLMEARADTPDGPVDLLTLVGQFAEHRSLSYRAGDHTLWGSSLSAMWRGRPHSFDRDAAPLVEKRRAFEASAASWDSVVATEVLPLATSLRTEFSAYYLRRFYCSLKRANPRARVYVYESYVHFNGSDPHAGYGPPHKFDWRAHMHAQIPFWEELADAAASGSVRAPSLLSRFGLASRSDGGCDDREPIFSVPVGRAMLRLAERLAAPRAGDDFLRPSGDRLQMADLYANPYVTWPSAWPTAEKLPATEVREVFAGLRARDPSKPLDDIHPSALGIYFTALVHFSTLYRQSPVGLPIPNYVGDGVGRTLQCIAWETVLSTPRAGVMGQFECS